MQLKTLNLDFQKAFHFSTRVNKLNKTTKQTVYVQFNLSYSQPNCEETQSLSVIWDPRMSANHLTLLRDTSLQMDAGWWLMVGCQDGHRSRIWSIKIVLKSPETSVGLWSNFNPQKLDPHEGDISPINPR